jgi:hypothetical protein
MAAGIGWRVGSYTRGDTHTPGAGPPPPDDEEAFVAVKLALELGANVRAPNDAGDTALHGAVNTGYAPIVQLWWKKEWMSMPRTGAAKHRFSGRREPRVRKGMARSQKRGVDASKIGCALIIAPTPPLPLVAFHL